jgi:hypothetical protein
MILPIRPGNNICTEGNFLSLKNFTEDYATFNWYGIYEPDFDDIFLNYLFLHKYKCISYDLENGFGEPFEFTNHDKDIFFFGCYIIYNDQLSLIYNWFDEYIILNDAVDIFLQTKNSSNRQMSIEFGGPFNDIHKCMGSDILLSLSNLKS